jgi:hypothetical protein
MVAARVFFPIAGGLSSAFLDRARHDIVGMAGCLLLSDIWLGQGKQLGLLLLQDFLVS